jgi:N-acetylglucosaminyldiphosphoundecaprenol N-acetyl-beta-D-mannosaminyltransferase
METPTIFPVQSVQILGIQFFNGTADEAVEQLCRQGGFVTVPAAPALVRLQHDEVYSRAMVAADLTIPDSGLMVLTWKILRQEKLRRISGLAYLKALVRHPGFAREPGSTFVLPNEPAKEKLLQWARAQKLPIDPDRCYVAPIYSATVDDTELLGRIARDRPAHIVVAIGNGPQEKLGFYLRQNLDYRPAIHCIGAALGFLTGDQVTIPAWADRF